MQVISFKSTAQTTSFLQQITPAVELESFCSVHNITGTTLGNPGLLPNAYSASQIVSCGKFDLYFEDMLIPNAWGFNGANGSVRRATLCEVFTYIQSVFNFSQVPLLTDQIKIEITSSYETGFTTPNPTYLAAAGPTFPLAASTTPGFYGGFVYDKINNYSAYSNSNFDGRLTFNFNGDIHDDFNTSIGNCKFDLYSIALHEVLHLLGWFSFLQENPTPSPNPNHHLPMHNTSFGLHPNAWSKLDEHCLYHGDISTGPFDKWIILNGSLPEINPALNYANSMRDNKTYLGAATRFNDNHPVYCGSVLPMSYNSNTVVLGQIFTHMEGLPNSSNKKYWLTPGFRAKYIMGPGAANAVLNREITNAEIRTLMLMGYNLNPLFAATIPPISSGVNGTNTQWTNILNANHKPEYMKEFSCKESGSAFGYDHYPDLKEWADGTNSGSIPNVAVDFTVTNNGIPLDINLNSMPATFYDADGDIITAIPSSIVGIRGVSNGDNNHDCISLINNNQTIRYLPRTNFMGRAQFYFQLFDGKELGGLALITIDVTVGSTFSNTPVNEMIINGGFEEGTEIKDLNSTTNISKEGNWGVTNLYEGQFYQGYAFADAHPLWQLNTRHNHWTNRGFVFRNSLSNCWELNPGAPPYSFGVLNNTFPFSLMNFWKTPNSINGMGTNNRYAQLSMSQIAGNPLFSWHTNYSTLSASPIDGEIYKLECDIFFPDSYSDPSINLPGYPNDWSLQINFTDQYDLLTPTNCYSKTMDLGQHTTCICLSVASTPQTGQWEHVTKYFQYCCNQLNPSIKYIELKALMPPASEWSPFYVTYIDNISLTHSSISATNLTIDATATPTINCFNHQLDVIVKPSDLFCNLSFSWSPITYLSNPNIQNPLAVNVTSPITYVVTVTDGYGFSQTSTVSIVPQIIPVAIAIPYNVVCPGNSVTLLGSGGGSTATYTWTGGVINNIPFVPLNTTTYIVTISEPGGCTATTSITVTVATPPIVTASAFPTILCPSGSSILTASGANNYVWNFGTNPTIAGNSITVTVPGIYIITGTDVNGCTGTTSLNVIDGSFTSLITSANSTHCTSNELFAWPYDPLNPSLYSYSWSGPSILPPPPGNSQSWATLSTQGTYVVTVTNTITNCTSTATFILSNGPDITISNTINGTWCDNLTADLLVNFVTPGYPPYTFSWTPAAGLIPNSISNPVTTPILTGTTNYQVIVTDDQLCSTTGNVLVMPNINFCCSPDAFTVASDPATITLDNVNSSTLPAFGGIAGLTLPAGQVLFINGAYAIDDNTLWQNAHIYFTPNSKIVVASNKFLSLSNCRLETPNDCDMWDGIYASNIGSQVYISNNSTLRDMANGAVISNQGHLQAYNSNFEDNYISIQLKNLPSNYAGNIKECNFSGITGLKAPYNLVPRPQHGIMIENCTNITIGGSPTEFNTFDNLFNGIHIRNSLQMGSSIIITDYNKFKNIIGTQPIWSPSSGIPYYQDANGCGIFGINNTAYYNIKLQHTGNNIPTVYDFFNCQKAILLNGVGGFIMQNYTENTEGAFMLNSNGITQNVLENHINNTYVGVQMVGNNFGNINANYISGIKSQAYMNTPPIVDQYWGKGIDWKATPSSIPSNNVVIIDNVISSNEADFVVGIDISNAPNSDVVNNNITFTTTNNVPITNQLPSLRGISFANSKNISILNNYITGPNYSLGNDARKTAGIYMHRSPNNYLACNVMMNLQNGFYILGNNVGYNFVNGQQNGGVEQNGVTTTRFGWLFRHLVENGTFGDVGEDNVYDANNKFHEIGGLASICQEVYRVMPSATAACDPNLQPTIFTINTNLTQGQSTTNASLNCRYKVNNLSPGIPYICNPPVPIPPQEAPGDFGDAIEIANDDVEYTEFPELGEWFDERELFGWLHSDPDARTLYPVLNQFYLDRQADNIALLNEIDMIISTLIDPLTLENQTLFEQTLATVKALNNSVGSTELYELNEKEINNLFIKQVEFGTESLTAYDNVWISTLAWECPYVAGNAVFKARSLYTRINPMAYFEDLDICNNVGVYKNGGGGLFDDENAALNNITDNNLDKSVGNKIILYPNPADEFITIKYSIAANEHAQLELIDIWGRKIKSIELSSSSNTVMFDIKSIASGVYTYKYIVNNLTVEAGKIIIE